MYKYKIFKLSRSGVVCIRSVGFFQASITQWAMCV